MASSNLAGLLIAGANLAAKVAIRATYGPRVSAPLEQAVQAVSAGAMKRYGISVDDPSKKKDQQAVKIATPEEAREFWEGNVPARQGSIELVVGSQRTGKTALASRLCEVWQRNGKSSLWLAIDPEGVQHGLNKLVGCNATAISRKHFMDRIRARDIQDSVIVIDDATSHFNQFSSQTTDSQDLQSFLAVEVTKGHNHLLLLTQDTGLVGRHVMQPSVVWIKPPLATYEDFERGGMLRMCRRAVKGYEQIPHDEWVQWVFVTEFGAIGSFSAMVPVIPATGWSQGLSEAR